MNENNICFIDITKLSRHKLGYENIILKLNIYGVTTSSDTNFIRTLYKLKKIFNEVDFYVDKEEFPPHIFRSYYPLKVHVDTGKDNSDKIIYKQILIPLKIPFPLCLIKLVFPCIRFFVPMIFDLNTCPIIWCPKQTPNIGIDL